MRVLIVEDAPELAALLCDGVRAQRIDPTLATTFAEGRERAGLSTFDVIILDVRLPGGSGFELCGELRRGGVTTPVLMLTALDAVDDRVRGLEVGADDYLTKPFAFRELLPRPKPLPRRPPPLPPAGPPLLGTGLFLTVRRQMSRHLDVSLRAAAAALEQAARIRESERAGARGAVVDAVDELHIPDRVLYLLDGDFDPIKPAVVPDWIRDAALQAAETKHGYRDLEAPDRRKLRVYVERFTGTTGTPYVAAVAADRLELEDEYASLIEAFAAAALAAMLLVAGGGSLLVRKSTAPVRRSMEQMRRFMADAAHELRTPITLLRTRAEVAAGQEREPSRDAAAFQAIEREAARLGDITGELLTLARADAGEWPVVRETLYLDDAVAGAVDATRARADQRRGVVGGGGVREAGVSGGTGVGGHPLAA